MRTLFLLGIMFFLWVIAIKEPNQSTWDAARVIGSKVDTAISVVRGKRIPVANKGGTPDSGVGENKPAAILPIKTTRPARPKISVAPPPTVVAKPLPRPVALPFVRETAPRPRVASLPKIPAVPVAPVKVAGIGAAPPPAPEPVPAAAAKPAPVWKYQEIKSFYENASRLLAEIK